MAMDKISAAVLHHSSVFSAESFSVDYAAKYTNAWKIVRGQVVALGVGCWGLVVGVLLGGCCCCGWVGGLFVFSLCFLFWFGFGWLFLYKAEF